MTVFSTLILCFLVDAFSACLFALLFVCILLLFYCRSMPVEIETMIYKKVKKVSCGGRMTAACVIRSWVQDQEAKTCMACKLQFTTLRRRVRIRICNLSTVPGACLKGLDLGCHALLFKHLLDGCAPNFQNMSYYTIS